MKLVYKWSDILRGAIIYTAGDLIASLILGEFSWLRLLGMALVGATFYAFEIPNYFKWIDGKTQQHEGYKKSFYKTLLAMLYFNPLWIARHLLFIKLAAQQYEAIDWNLMEVALISFLFNIPVSFLANFLIQNKVHLKWRFLASAIFSALMAIYYALSEIMFS